MVEASLFSTFDFRPDPESSNPLVADEEAPSEQCRHPFEESRERSAP